MAISVQTDAFDDTQMYYHKTFIPWLLAAMTPGATIMDIDADALVGSPGRLAELLTALASGGQRPRQASRPMTTEAP